MSSASTLDSHGSTSERVEMELTTNNVKSGLGCRGIRDDINGGVERSNAHPNPFCDVGDVADDTETLLNPLFPPISTHHSLATVLFYQYFSAILSSLFLIFAIVLCAMIKSTSTLMWTLWSWCQFKDPNRFRPFYREEKAQKHLNVGELRWDIAYYAQRVGLECDDSKIETEDGFILTMHHIVDRRDGAVDSKQKYPVLLLHGLLQAAGTFCVNDDSSLAFFLCKSGYDVWLGNNRGYFQPEHVSLKSSDPKFWAWNLQQMGCIDLPAMVAYVRAQTGREKIALVAHSQGTVLTFLALARSQVPRLGESLSCFVALAPAVYAGSLLSETLPFAFIKIMFTRTYRMCFGIHSFIPLMSMMHKVTPGPVYGWLGYRVFNYLFSWTDWNWELRLRNRLFQFSPVIVSAECMRWWLGNECFSHVKCIFPDTGIRWYDPTSMPPVSLYIGGRDKLVNGQKLIDRLERIEADVNVIRVQVDEDYEHLDCLWSMDCIERIGKNVRDDIWMTTAADDVQIPKGCNVEDRGRLIATREADLIGLTEEV